MTAVAKDQASRLTKKPAEPLLASRVSAVPPVNKFVDEFCANSFALVLVFDAAAAVLLWLLVPPAAELAAAVLAFVVLVTG